MVWFLLQHSTIVVFRNNLDSEFIGIDKLNSSAIYVVTIKGERLDSCYDVVFDAILPTNVSKSFCCLCYALHQVAAGLAYRLLLIFFGVIGASRNSFGSNHSQIY